MHLFFVDFFVVVGIIDPLHEDLSVADLCCKSVLYERENISSVCGFFAAGNLLLILSDRCGFLKCVFRK